MRIIFCPNCGKKINSDEKICPFCKKMVITKNHPFFNLLYENISDDLKGKVRNNFFSVLANFIKSHLYGTILTFAIIGSIGASVVSNNTNNSQKTTEKPTIKEIVKYNDNVELLDNFISALVSGDEATLNTMMYKTFYNDEYEEYFSKSENFITAGTLQAGFDIRDYTSELKNLEDYYVVNFYDVSKFTSEEALDTGNFETRYFDEDEILAKNGIDVAEGYFILCYCLDKEKYEIDYTCDYEIGAFYLFANDQEGNWYVFKTLSDENNAYKVLKSTNGNLLDIVKENK